MVRDATRPDTGMRAPGDDVGFSTLGEIVGRWRAGSPTEPAVITGDAVVTIAAFADLVDSLVDALEALVPPGSRVALLAPNGLVTAALLYAVPASGRALVPLNGRLLPTEQATLIERSGAALLLGDPVEGFDGPTIPLDELVAIGSPSAARDEPRTAPTPGDVAWVIFTSGTTGRPKGVLVTHASLAAAVRTTAAGRPLADDDVYLYPFPLFHVSAYNVLHAHARRRPVVLPHRFDAAEVLDLAEQHEVTAMSLAPTMLRMLLDELAASGRRPPSHLTNRRLWRVADGRGTAPRSVRRARLRLRTGVRHDRAVGQRRVPLPRRPPSWAGR